MCDYHNLCRNYTPIDEDWDDEDVTRILKIAYREFRDEWTEYTDYIESDP